METPRFHRNLFDATEAALKEIFVHRKYADAVIESVLKQNKKWGSRDRRFIAETTYDVVRWWRKLLYCLNASETDEGVFRNAIYAWLSLQGEKLPEWITIDHDRIILRSHEADQIRAIRESIPDWLDELGENELGDTWERELHALNEPAKVVLRVNRLKATRDELQKELFQSGIETDGIDSVPDALVLKKRANVFQQPSFKEGKFEVQDASSQQVAVFLQPEAGMRIVDGCAGAGGKTLHLASLMKNTGHIIALDVDQRKLDELRRRARRGGATNIETRFIDSSKIIKRLNNSADRILLDVPCSGLGVLKRNPDAKWKLTPEYLERVKNLQRDILDRYSQMVKNGGKLVYATCSILPSENQQQVENFLQHHKNFMMEDEKQILPSEGYDGFYMSRMVCR